MSRKEILDVVAAKHPHRPLPPKQIGEVASRWIFDDGSGEFGIISSVTKPFCQNCNRLRVSADGKLFACLFASDGFDLKSKLREGVDDDEVRNCLSGFWQKRDDRYSELRGSTDAAKAEMSYLGG